MKHTEKGTPVALSERERELAPKAVAQIRDALATLSYASDGHFEDEAQVALDALDWLEARVLAPNDP